MLRRTQALITAAGLAVALLASSYSAHAEYTGSSGVALRFRELAEDSVTSIGATAIMNEHDVIIAVPAKGKLVATANADVFCSGDETARKLEVEVEEAQNVMLEFCEAHLERRDVLIRFVADQ